jgi:spermidine/putrescine transport system ATP-binding protein
VPGRVALARGVVMEPEVLLLDEPLAALDLKLRKEMQVEVKNLQERLGTTFVFVTHDQDEALVMSDRIAVLNDGRVEQVGTPEEIYERPRARLRTAKGLALLAADDGGYRAGESVWVGIRPERLRLSPPGEALTGSLDDEIYRGDHTEWRVRVGGEEVAVTEDAATASGRRRGESVSLLVPPEAVLRLEP